MGILEENIILGSANASPNMIFFKDPIYFRITPLSVYITNNMQYGHTLELEIGNILVLVDYFLLYTKFVWSMRGSIIP